MAAVELRDFAEWDQQHQTLQPSTPEWAETLGAAFKRLNSKLSSRVDIPYNTYVLPEAGVYCVTTPNKIYRFVISAEPTAEHFSMTVIQTNISNNFLRIIGGPQMHVTSISVDETGFTFHQKWKDNTGMERCANVQISPDKPDYFFPGIDDAALTADLP